MPRLYEKVYARVLENALSGSVIKRTIFFWAKRAGEQWATLSLAGLPIPGGLRVKKTIADRLVFAKLRARTGGKIRFFVSGAAPLSADIAKFFYSAGLPVIEGSLAWATCDLRELIPGGDHTIAIGQVTAMGLGQGAPLLWYGGRYHEWPGNRASPR